MARVIGPLGLLAAFTAAGGVAARAAADETPPRTAPTREYVYAGSRFLAVVGPLPSVRPVGVAPSLSESDGTARVEVELRTADGAPLSTEASFAFRAVAGTARAGEDYVATTGTLVFDQPGQLQQSVRVPILDDLLAEGPERFRLVLHSAAGAILGPATANVALRDDETSPAPPPGNPPPGEGQ